jgi:hypothetical protein
VIINDVPERKPYIFRDLQGREYALHGESAPIGHVEGTFELQTKRNGHAVVGPNYDGTWNSILAALEYEAVRGTVMWKCWRHLWIRNRQWVPGRDLLVHGSEALRRVRDLRKLGWPLRERPGETLGPWDYRLYVAVPPMKLVSNRRH